MDYEEETEMRKESKDSSPAEYSQTPVAARSAVSDSEPSIEKSLMIGWEIFKSNIGFLIALQLIWLAVIIGLEVVEHLAFAGAPLFVMAIWLIVYNVVNIFIGAGILKIGFYLIDAQPAELSDLFSQVDVLLPLVIGYIIFFLGSFIGTVLLILPGIYFFLRFFFYDFFIVDDKMGVIESFKKSWQATAGINKTVFLLLMLVVFVFINILGLIALGIGLLVTIPVTTLAFLNYYRQYKLAMC